MSLHRLGRLWLLGCLLSGCGGQPSPGSGEIIAQAVLPANAAIDEVRFSLVLATNAAPVDTRTMVPPLYSADVSTTFNAHPGLAYAIQLAATTKHYSCAGQSPPFHASGDGPISVSTTLVCTCVHDCACPPAGRLIVSGIYFPLPSDAAGRVSSVASDACHVVYDPASNSVSVSNGKAATCTVVVTLTDGQQLTATALFVDHGACGGWMPIGGTGPTGTWPF